MVNTQRAILDATKRGDRKITLVDTKGLAKPNTYDGSTDFLQWKIRFEAFVTSVHDDMEDPMNWAEEEADPILHADKVAQFGP